MIYQWNIYNSYNQLGVYGGQALAALLDPLVSGAKPYYTHLLSIILQLKDEIRSVLLQNFPQLLSLLEDNIALLSAYFPFLKDVGLFALDSIFAPRKILLQLIIAFTIQYWIIFFNGITYSIETLLDMMSIKGSRIREMHLKMKNALTYHDWMQAAVELDKLEGNEKWRQEEDSPLYDVKATKKRIADLKRMMESGDVFNLMFRLRGGLSRHQFGMQHDGLFTRACAGTKKLIENYHETVKEALNYILNYQGEEIPTDAKLAFFNETRHSYGRTALMLSGGGCLGFYHVGPMSQLFEDGLLPRVLSGASAGSLLAGILGTHTDEELSYFNPNSFNRDFLRFDWETDDVIARSQKSGFRSLFPKNFRWIADMLYGVFVMKKQLIKFDTNKIIEVSKENIGTYTFQEAFDRTGRITNITVAPVNPFDPPRLLNYLTAPHVCVWSAAVASSAIPGVFDAIPLIVKEPNGEFRAEHEWTVQGSSETNIPHHYSDGSIENDLPMNQISELFNVNHFIVSQVNPHSALISTLSVEASVWSPRFYGLVVGILRFLKTQCRDWIKAITDLLVFRTVGPMYAARRGLSYLLTQDYGGKESDITIHPWGQHISVIGAFANMIKNPNQKEYDEVIINSRRSIWPHLGRIRAHCSVEIALDQCVQKLRQQVAIENRKESLGLIKTGRVPSFYTTKSIVNISGLSVSDPAPKSCEETMESLFTNEAKDSQSYKISPTKADSSQFLSPQSYAQENISVLPSPQTTVSPSLKTVHTSNTSVTTNESGSSSNNLYMPMKDQATGYENEWYNMTVEVPGMPLDAEYYEENTMSAGRERSASESELKITKSNGGNVLHKGSNIRTNQSSDNLVNPEVDRLTGSPRRLAKKTITKTTSMSNFYYKHSNSQDNLKSMGSSSFDNLSKMN